MIITIASLKGGTGKTSLSVHIAHAIALRKRRVLLADADPQSSACDWAAAREEKPPFPVIGMARDTLHRDLPELSSNYDHTVIDTPPRVSALARSAILAADLVLIPVQPSSFDIWSAQETVKLVEEAKGFKPDLRAAFVINRKISGTIIGREAQEALTEFELPTLNTAIAQRIAIAEASAGYSVFESSPKGAAAKEFKALGKDILKLMEVKTW